MCGWCVDGFVARLSLENTCVLIQLQIQVVCIGNRKDDDGFPPKTTTKHGKTLRTIVSIDLCVSHVAHNTCCVLSVFVNVCFICVLTIASSCPRQHRHILFHLFEKLCFGG